MGRIRNRSKEMLSRIEAAERFDPDMAVGLSAQQVEARKKSGLGNKTKKQVTKSYFRIFADNLFSFFNLVFLLTAALMLYAGITTISSYLFLLILFANVVIGLISDIRARVLVDRLRMVTDPKATVIRGGSKKEVPTEEVVLDDILLLKAGDTVPCDCKVREGDINVDESLLTGESEPVRKKTGEEILSGSVIKSGRAYVQAQKVGAASYSETLRTSAQHFERPKSEIKRSTMAIFAVTAISAIFVAILMALTYQIPIWTGQVPSTAEGFKDFVSRLSGSIISAIPTGLYLLTSLTLAVGIITLARKRMNVQELYSIEMLARVDTVCFDKTGTLTDGSMSVSQIIPLDEKYSKEDILKLAYSVVSSTLDENSTALAIARAGEGYVPFKSRNIAAFDSFKKYSAATFDPVGTIAIGAYGFVEAKEDALVASRINAIAEEGYRAIMVYLNKKPLVDAKLQGLSIPIGIICLHDTIKSDAKDNIKWFMDNGVAIKVISGDDPLTVRQIASQVGVPDANKAVSMEGVRQDQIPEYASKYTVFGRVSPEQKAWLVEELQKQGHTVAMTGDGVNDMLALKKADCSIAMASGSAAARNISHLIAMDNDFGHLPEVVGEGRRVINNLQRTASLFLAKNIFAIVLSLVFIVSDWAGGEAYPFTTQNMLLWEIFAIGIPAFFLSLQPTKEKLHGSFLRNVLEDAVPAGISEILVVILIYIPAMFPDSFIDLNTARTLSVLAFSAISLCTLFRVSLPPNRFRLIVFGVAAFVCVGVVIATFLLGPDWDYLGLEKDICNFGALNITYTILITAGAGVLFLFSEAVRSYIHKRLNKRKGKAENENQ